MRVQLLVTADAEGFHVQGPAEAPACVLEAMASSVLKYCLAEGASLEAVLAAMERITLSDRSIVMRPLVMTDRNS